MRNKIFLALTALLLCAACDEDSFSTTVDIPIPDHESLVALTMDARAGDTAIYFRLALSQGILEEPENGPFNATISLYKDDEEVITLAPVLPTSAGNSIEYPLADTLSTDPATYRVVATVEGYPEVEATQEMPALPVISNLTYEVDGGVDLNGDRVDVVEFDLTDAAASEDYYGVRVLTRPGDQISCYDNGVEIVCDTFYNDFIYALNIDSPDPLTKASSGYGLVITDDAFNGDTYRLRFQVFNYQEQSIQLEVLHLTEDAYRYGVSRRAYEDAGDNPFAEPVSVHNNVDGGYGYFIMANKVVVPLE